MNKALKAPTSDILVFDRKSVRQNRQRAAKSIQDHNFLFDWAMNNIMDSLSLIKKEFPAGLIFGNRHNQNINEQIKSLKNIETFIEADLFMTSTNTKTNTVMADDEYLPFARNSFNLVINNLGLHSINDLPGALIQINHALKPDGLFLGAMFGGETLHELRQVMAQTEMKLTGGTSPHIFPFADKQQMGALLQRAGFALPVVDSEIVTVTYDNAFKLMHDLRGMGESNTIIARSKKPATKNFMFETAKLYQKQFSDPDWRIRASFEIIFLLGWAPHQSQQKPLRPGSADHSMAEALGSEEHKTGEKTQP